MATMDEKLFDIGYDPNYWQNLAYELMREREHLHAEVDEMRQQRDRARRWAGLWKYAARLYFGRERLEIRYRENLEQEWRARLKHAEGTGGGER